MIRSLWCCASFYISETNRLVLDCNNIQTSYVPKVRKSKTCAFPCVRPDERHKTSLERHWHVYFTKEPVVAGRKWERVYNVNRPGVFSWAEKWEHISEKCLNDIPLLFSCMRSGALAPPRVKGGTAGEWGEKQVWLAVHQHHTTQSGDRENTSNLSSRPWKCVCKC